MPCTSAYYEKPKHVKESANCIRKMHLLTRDVGISIALTMKIVVQFTVATDVYLSTLFVTPCTYSLVKMKHVKITGQRAYKVARVDAGRHVPHW